MLEANEKDQKKKEKKTYEAEAEGNVYAQCDGEPPNKKDDEPDDDKPDDDAPGEEPHDGQHAPDPGTDDTAMEKCPTPLTLSQKKGPTPPTFPPPEHLLVQGGAPDPLGLPKLPLTAGRPRIVPPQVLRG